MIGLKWRETSCDRLGEVAGSNGDSSGGGDSSDGGSSDGGSSDGGSSDGGSDYSDGASDIPHLHEELKDFHDKGYDTTWVKQKVSAFKGEATVPSKSFLASWLGRGDYLDAASACARRSHCRRCLLPFALPLLVP